MGTQIADAVITVNNDAVGIVPDSLQFNEGLGEQRVLPVSDGGGAVSQVFGNDLTTNFAEVQFSIRTTAQNIKNARQWKTMGNGNVVTIAGEDADGNDFIRTFTQAALTENYNVMIQAEGTIDLVFKSNAAT